jgi:hypothetical protein
MIDWFVVLVPLVLLPIVLLFVFVGCTYDYDVLVLLPVILHYGPGSETNVESIEVTFEFGAHSSTRTLFHQDSVPDGGEIIKPDGGKIEEFVAPVNEEGQVECTCLIKMKQTPVPQFEPASAHKEEDEDLQGHFELSRDGDSFNLDYVEEPG